VLRILAASIVYGAVAFGVWWLLDEALGRAFPAQVVSVFGALAVGGVAYLFSARLLGVRELNALLSLRSRARPAE
jgi:hypothetical protein